MFFKKKRELEKLKCELDLKERELEYYKESNCILEEKMKNIQEEKYKEYDWAILCNNYTLTVINGGRIEEKVRRVTVDSDTGMIPTITIEK